VARLTRASWRKVSHRQSSPVGPLAMRETAVSRRHPWRQGGTSDILSVGLLAMRETAVSRRHPDVLSVGSWLCRLSLTLLVLGMWAQSPMVSAAGLAPGAVLDASGSVDLKSRLRRDPAGGRPYVPREPLDEEALLKRFAELYKAFVREQQRVEERHFQDYPVIRVPATATSALGTDSIDPSAPLPFPAPATGTPPSVGRP
jgi:hypothetical protein